MKNTLHQIEFDLERHDGETKPLRITTSNISAFTNGDSGAEELEVEIRSDETSIKYILEKQDALELAAFINFLYS